MELEQFEGMLNFVTVTGLDLCGQGKDYCKGALSTNIQVVKTRSKSTAKISTLPHIIINIH